MDIIGSEIHRLDRVVQTLVDFSRPVELQLADARSAPAVAGSRRRWPRRRRERHAGEDRAHRGRAAAAGRVDSDLIKQALLNVVLNGVQAMPDGGVLSSAAPARRAFGRQLGVRDQGAGIPPEIRDKIFNLYFTTKKTGSGIGLAMSYRVLQLHNGSLDFDSEVGKGTTFRFILPLSAGSDEKGKHIAVEAD